MLNPISKKFLKKLITPVTKSFWSKFHYKFVDYFIWPQLINADKYIKEDVKHEPV
jgi:chemotaxis methyl-accepting protein methylase